jgi:hypothetical protein
LPWSELQALYAPKPDETVEKILQAVYNNGRMADKKLLETNKEDILPWMSVNQAEAVLVAHYAAKEQEAYIAGVNADKRSVQEAVLRARIEEHISYKNTLLSVIELYPTDNDWARGRKQGIQDCINDQDEYIADLTNQLAALEQQKAEGSEE